MADLSEEQELLSQELSKHQKRKLKKEVKKQENEEKEKQIEKAKQIKKLKKYALYGLGILILGAFVFSVMNSSTSTKYPDFTPGQIHWHAIPTVSICGQPKSLPRPIPGKHLGSNLLHTHEDGKIHVEGYVSDPSQITLQMFFGNIGVQFTENQIFDKKNGDTCPDGKQGTVTVYVNSNKTDDFLNYPVKDNDVVEIKFG